MGDITQLISSAREGDRSALNALFEILHPDLRRIAHARLSPHVRDVMLGTTSLVNECYLKFVQGSRLSPGDRAHFLAYSATAMRSIIVDAARFARAERRGGSAVHVPLDTVVNELVPQPEDEILDVHDALAHLEKLDKRLAQVVEMRYFGGLSDLEIARALGVTDRTVRRDWEKARLLLSIALRV
jgi:RNA polymerase sigma factor (TIGR02999 family)